MDSIISYLEERLYQCSSHCSDFRYSFLNLTWVWPNLALVTSRDLSLSPPLIPTLALTLLLAYLLFLEKTDV